jgi:hypothetical protein
VTLLEQAATADDEAALLSGASVEDAILYVEPA